MADDEPSKTRICSHDTKVTVILVIQLSLGIVHEANELIDSLTGSVI